MSEKLSRRQRAKLRASENKSFQEDSGPSIEVKSMFVSNNPGLNLNLFDQLMRIVSQDAKIADIVKSNSTLATCVDIIATKVSTIPLSLYRQQRNGDFIPVRGKRHTDHIFSKPNKRDTQQTLMYKLVSFFLMYGNAFLVKAGDQIFAFPPTKVFPDNGNVLTAKSFKISIDSQTQIDVPAKFVCQVFKPGQEGTDYFSTVRNAIVDIILNTEIKNQSTNHIKTGMMAKGLLMQEKEALSGLSKAQMNELTDSFTKATSGSNSAKTIMLPKGISYQTIQQTAAEAGLLALLDTSRKDIVIAFKIPESIFNSEAGASYATANIQEINFFKNTIKPLATFIETFINYWDQVTSETEYFKFELGEMISAEEEKMKADTSLVKAQTALTLKQLKLHSANELREKCGDEKITDSQGNQIPDADVNPFELNDFNTADNTIAEELDADAIVKMSDVILSKKAKKCNHE